MQINLLAIYFNYILHVKNKHQQLQDIYNYLSQKWFKREDTKQVWIATQIFYNLMKILKEK